MIDLRADDVDRLNYKGLGKDVGIWIKPAQKVDIIWDHNGKRLTEVCFVKKKFTTRPLAIMPEGSVKSVWMMDAFRLAGLALVKREDIMLLPAPLGSELGKTSILALSNC